MTRRIESRLAHLERQRDERDAVADNPNRPKHLSELLGGPYDPTITFARLLAESAELFAPPPPDPTICPKNVFNVDSEIRKMTGDLEGWRENEMKIKRWSPEWEQENWPEGPPAKDCP